MCKAKRQTNNNNMCEIIDYWRQLEFNNGNELIHPNDNQILGNVNRINLDFNNYIGNCDNLFGNNLQLHTGLIPVPYSGDIRKARIYINDKSRISS